MLSIGPLMIPTSVLALAISIALGLIAARVIENVRGHRVGVPAFPIVAMGLVAARLAFVALHLEPFRENPMAVFNIRDGGWSWSAGLAVAWIAGMVSGWRKSSRRAPILAALFVGTTAWMAAASWPTAGPAQKMLMPEHFEALRGGSSVDIASFQGKPVVINLWASWCPPCRREMPALAEAQRENPDIHVVFLNQGEPAQAVRAYERELGQNIKNVLLDTNSKWAKTFSNGALPATIFFDAQGHFVSMRLGEVSRATLQTYIQSLQP